MYVFISYASEYRDIADSIAIGLQQAGHQVFYDRDDLLPGEAFDEKIRQAIYRADLLIYLVSPESVEIGSYTLTELHIARTRWRNPAGRLMPVMVAKTPLDTVPPYLRAVTILEPKGNRVAEVLAAVEHISKAKQRRIIVAAMLLVSILAVAVVSILLKVSHQTTTECFLVAQVHHTNTSVYGLDPQMTLKVRGEGGTNMFLLSEQGEGALQIKPGDRGKWSITLEDTRGIVLGSAETFGCPEKEKELRLNDDFIIKIRPR